VQEATEIRVRQGFGRSAFVATKKSFLPPPPVAAFHTLLGAGLLCLGAVRVEFFANRTYTSIVLIIRDAPSEEVAFTLKAEVRTAHASRGNIRS